KLSPVNHLVTYMLASVYLYPGSLPWETRLLAQFGEEYIDYQKKVPKDDSLEGKSMPWTDKK
ncbi:MAG: hypothetical protein NTW84_00560, partial [Methanothrix sp.]|nr:hypothetical protein [Methanothrix sp.]